MEKKGSITVFLTLMLSLLLSLLCTSIESVRMASARTQIINGMDIGLYSLFGEYDKDLLKDYHLFLLDGSCGGGTLKLSVIYKELESYLKPVLKQNSQKLTFLQGGLDSYRLVTDEDGEVFYQQVIHYMRETLGIHGVQLLLDRVADESRKTDQAKERGMQLENQGSLNSYDQAMDQAERESSEALEKAKKEAKEESERTGQEIVVVTPAPVKVNNPIHKIKKIMRMGILDVVIPGAAVSANTVERGRLVSGRRLQTGLPSSQPLKPDNSYTSGILFQQYLMEQLGSYAKPAATGLQYQIEYILKGKYSDRENLKAVAKDLLLIREGVNIASLMSSPVKQGEVETLATAIASSFLFPPAAGVIEAALILCWTFAESILDLRELYSGGRVPLIKDDSDWQISLENLPELLGRMDEFRKNDPEGLNYEDYLQILFLKVSKRNRIFRGMDMIECTVREKEGRAEFMLDSCITGLEASADIKANKRMTFTVSRGYYYN